MAARTNLLQAMTPNLAELRAARDRLREQVSNWTDEAFFQITYRKPLVDLLALLDALLAQEPVAEPTIIVTGPVACGKSYVMELIYKALRDAGLHPYSDDLARERRSVEEQPAPRVKAWKLRESVALPIVEDQ